MKSLRTALSITVIALLVAGYAASQWAVYSDATRGDFSQSSTLAYAKAIDCPPVKWAALSVLALSIVFAFIREPEANEK